VKVLKEELKGKGDELNALRLESGQLKDEL